MSGQCVSRGVLVVVPLRLPQVAQCMAYVNGGPIRLRPSCLCWQSNYISAEGYNLREIVLMSAPLKRCVLEVDGRPVGVLVPDGSGFVFTATDPEADLLTGTRHSSPEEALSVVRAHMWTLSATASAASPPPATAPAA